MSDDQRMFSDEEFALVLRKAAELGNRPETPAPLSGGFTLSEMQAAAAQVGIDPALVERAAWMVPSPVKTTPMARVIGGPMQHGHDMHFPIMLDEARASRLLSAVIIAAGQSGTMNTGHSSALGMTWNDGGETEVLKVTARPSDTGTAVSVTLDRRGTLVTAAVVSGMGMFLTSFAGFALYDISPALGVVAAAAGVGGVLTGARRYWTSSTAKVRERMHGVLAAIGKTLT